MVLSYKNSLLVNAAGCYTIISLNMICMLFLSKKMKYMLGFGVFSYFLRMFYDF